MDETHSYATRAGSLMDHDFVGAEAAFIRAGQKAVKRARAAGLEPVVSNPEDWETQAPEKR